MKEQIKYKDLSFWCKAGIIGGIAFLADVIVLVILELIQFE